MEKSEPGNKPPDINIDDNMKERNFLSDVPVDIDNNCNAEPIDERLGLESHIITKAREGDSFAQLDVAKAYYTTTNMVNSCEKAFFWLNLAASQQNGEAQFRLADLYALGEGIEKNEFAAYKWYLKAAIQGYPKALTRLQNVYHLEKSTSCRGLLIIQEEAWRQPEFKRENNVRELFEYRQQVLSATLTKLKQYFEDLIRDCRKQNTEEAYLILGFLYQHGYGIRRIRARAIEHYLLAAEKGNIDAKYNLGYIYHHNTDIKWNYRESVKFYTEAAEKGQIYAQSGLAYLYLKGLRVNMDYSKAHFWYTKAAEKRNVEAQISLARMFRQGQGVAQDNTKAVEWYLRAAKEGSTVAQNCIESLRTTEKTNAIEEDHSKYNKIPAVSTKRGLCSKLKADFTNIKHSVDSKSLEKLVTHALFGDAHAMFSIGKKYYDGNDFDQDQNTGFQWMLRSAKAGLVSSQSVVAKMYRDGDGVEQNFHKASIWFRKAAKKGDNAARCRLGLMYYYGFGVRKDPLEASKWLIFAAEKNHREAQFLLGLLHLNGEGLRQDIPEAMKWLTLSMKQKCPEAIYQQGVMYGNEVQKDTRNDVPKNWDIPISLLKIAAKMDNLDAQLHLGYLFADQELPCFDPSMALKYYEMAANQNNPHAYYKMAILYLDGKGVEQNFTTAHTLFKKAQELGNEDANNIFDIPINYHKGLDINYFTVIQMFNTVCLDNTDSLQFNLALMYRDDFTFEHDRILSSSLPDYKNSKKWCEIAAKNGIPEAQHLLGLIYEEGQGTDCDLSKSIYYYTAASKNNNIDACYKLASMHLADTHVSQDLKTAYELLKKASDLGHKESTAILGISESPLQKYGKETMIKMLEEGALSGNTIAQYTLGLYHSNSNDHEDGNFSEAVKWLTMASNGGYSDAFYKLGQIHESTNGTTQDYQEAIRLYHIVASKGNEDALYRIARICHSGHGVTQNYLEAFSYYNKAADQGSLLSQVAINVAPISVWEDDLNSKKNISEESPIQYNECFEMWKSLAEQGDPDMQYKLGLVYEQNKTDVDLSMAHSWYIRSAEHAHKDALYHLGRFYSEGLGVEKDYTLSRAYYEKSAEAGNIDALYQLGIMYENGHGVQVDNEKAIDYYNKAAENGSFESQFKLGMLYEEGQILQQDILKSVRHHTNAASQGSEKAYEHFLLLDYHKSADAYFLKRRFQLFYSLSKTRNEDTRDKVVLGSINYQLGIMYYDAIGTPVDFKKAWKHFKAATFVYGEFKALNFIHVRYQNPDVLNKDNYLRKLGMWKLISVQYVGKKTDNKEVEFTEEELLTKEEKYELALIYYYGVYATSLDGGVDNHDPIVRHNYIKSQNYFEAAAPKQVKVNLNSYSGDKNDKKAIEKYKSDQHYVQSSYHLGMINCAEMICNNGNNEQALYYLNHAAEGGHPNAREQLDTIIHGQDDQAELHKTVFDYLVSNTDSNDKINNYYIGWMYLNGCGTETNDKKAFDYFTISAARKHADSLYQLGLFYLPGKGFEEDIDKAIEFLIDAASQKHIEANHTLGTIYAGKDNRKAHEYFEVAARQGHSESQYRVGMLHRILFRTQKGIEEGNEWTIKAVEQDHAAASYNLALIYLNGYGVNKDLAMTRAYLEKSARLGSAEALFQLGVQYEQGYMVGRDDRMAIEYYKKAVDKNHDLACNNLGEMYFHGRGVEKNYERAIVYIKLAVEQGYGPSEWRLGYCYEKGLGIEKDMNQAIQLYTKANLQGNMKACYGLARAYFTGKGIQQDVKKAIEYFMKCGNQGNQCAQVRLGTYYLNGRGQEKDLNKAADWFSKANNHLYARYFLRSMYLSDTGIGEGYDTRLRHYKAFSGQGDGYLQFHLGNRYFNGDNVEKDISEAIKWYKLAAKQGHSLSSHKLGQIYSTGDGVEKDVAEAITWYSKAAARGHVLASYNLGQIHSLGNDAKKDYQKAFNYYKIAADKGYAEAQLQLANCYINGHGTENNIDEAIKWYKKAAEQRNSEASHTLGMIYWNGKGVDIDLEAAISYFTVAAEHGNTTSQAILGLSYLIGLGIERSFSDAIKWFYKSGDQGNIPTDSTSMVLNALGWLFKAAKLAYKKLAIMIFDLVLYYCLGCWTPNCNLYHIMLLWLFYSSLYVYIYPKSGITPSLFLLLFITSVSLYSVLTLPFYFSIVYFMISNSTYSIFF